MQSNSAQCDASSPLRSGTDHTLDRRGRGLLSGVQTLVVLLRPGWDRHLVDDVTPTPKVPEVHHSFAKGSRRDQERRRGHRTFGTVCVWCVMWENCTLFCVEFSLYYYYFLVLYIYLSIFLFVLFIKVFFFFFTPVCEFLLHY